MSVGKPLPNSGFFLFCRRADQLFFYSKSQFSQKPHQRSGFRQNCVPNSHKTVTFEKPGEILPVFRFRYADARRRSMILVLDIFLYRSAGITMVTISRNG